MTSTLTPIQRARLSLEGLSIGDALGGFLEMNNRASSSHIVVNRQPPNVVWNYTDDTNMALSIYAILREYQEINQDALAKSFAMYYDRSRGYGAGVRRFVKRINSGHDWREFNTAIYGGGSYGNGGAMRVAPIGAYFANNLEKVIEQARLSSELTHAHPEGIAGTIAVAVASAIATNLSGKPTVSRNDFINKLLPYMPESDVRKNITKILDLNTSNIADAVKVLGNGSHVSAQDTVPFVLFCASEWLSDYEEAIWQTMSGGGDVDTTCAMVGGIVACYVGINGIPQQWIAHRETLPQWAVQVNDLT